MSILNHKLDGYKTQDNECEVVIESGSSDRRVVMPPPGYVMLVEGQKIKSGDLYCRGVGHSWHETRIKGGYWTEHGNYPMCRRKPNAEVSEAADKRR